MGITILVFRQIAELFIMMLMGFVIVKAKLLKPSDNIALSMISIYIVCPAMIIMSFQTQPTQDKVEGLVLALLASAAVHLVSLICTAGFKKIFKLGTIESMSIIYTNAGNMVLPIVLSTLGEEYIIFTSGYMIVQLILLWTHCKSRIENSNVYSIRKILTNVNLISIILGLLLFFGRISLPTILYEPLSIIKQMVGPVCMFSIGMLIAGIDVKSVFSNRHVYLVVVLRMIIMPLIMLPLFRFAAATLSIQNAGNILLVVLLALTSPSASTVSQLAIAYENDAETAGAINVLTTLSSIVTMPLMIMLYSA